MPTLAPKLPWQHPFAGGYPGRSGQYLPVDADATDYLSRLAEVDGASVEVGIAQAIEAFITGCKADSAGFAGDPTRSNWDAIQASCIMCGARTISGALVPLKTPYGPELVDIEALPTPTVSDSGGSTGVWTPATRTLSSSTTGTSDTFPRFAFPVGMTIGKRYKVTLTLSLAEPGCLTYVRVGGATLIGGQSAVDSFVVDGVYTCTGTANFQIDLDATVAGAAVTIESLSIREDSFTPTPLGSWASGDYSRSGSTPGLKGNGTDKYLDTGLNNTSVGRDDRHVSIYRTYGNPAGGSHYQIGAYSSTPSPAHLTAIRPLSGGTCAMYGGGSNGPSVPSPAGYETGFLGVSRAVSTGFNYRTPSSGSLFFSSSNSNAPQDQNFFVFTTSLNGNSPFTYTDGRLAFYSVGAALDLAKMDTRVSNLVTAIRFHALTGLLPNDYDPDTIAYIVDAYEAGGLL